MDRPNVILVCVDQWRGDALGCEGHPIAMTPHLDQFAHEGIRFAKAYSATPSCIASRAALYTGLSQTSTGRIGYRDGVSWDYPVTIASEFTRHGYQTQAIGKLHVFPERSQVGFQNVILHDGYLHFARQKNRDLTVVDDYLMWLREKTGDPRADYFDNGLNCNSQVARPWDKEEALHPSTWIVTQAIDYFRRLDPRKPFFLYLGFHRPHPPYDPPVWAFEQHLRREMPDPPVGDWYEDVLAPLDNSWRADPSVAKLSGEALRRARAGYFGHISHIDLLMNRLQETLDGNGLRWSTNLCFVSDHGELLGDHHAFRKELPYEGSARVPFLLSGPGLPRNVVVSDKVVELRDVMPTLLDSAGLQPPDGLDGKSALPLAKGNQTEWREYLHGEHTVYGQTVQWITDGRWKYIWWSGTGREQLFDLQNDPRECRDLHQTPEIEPWRQRLIDELTNRPEGFVSNGALVTGRPVDPVLSHH